MSSLMFWKTLLPPNPEDRGKYRLLKHWWTSTKLRAVNPIYSVLYCLKCTSGNNFTCSNTFVLLNTNSWEPEDNSILLTTYEGKSISKLQMDIEFKQIRVLIWKILLFVYALYPFVIYLLTYLHIFGSRNKCIAVIWVIKISCPYIFHS
jgi:hypothetical protein